MEMLGLIVLGCAISVLLVQRASRKGAGVELTLVQSLKVVLVRGGVALGLGFGLGRGISWMLEAGIVSPDVISQNPYLTLTVLTICGLGSFIAFQWVVGRVSGSSISVLAALKASLYELGYFALGIAALFVLIVVVSLSWTFLGGANTF